MCLMAPATPIAESQPWCCCGTWPDSHVSFVPALVSCWPVQWPRSHSVPCCGILIRRCSATPPSVSTTTSPKFVAQYARCLQMLIVVFWGMSGVTSASECPSIVTALSSSCSENSHTARGVWSKYRPFRFKRVRSARVAFDFALAFFVDERGVRSVRREVRQSC